MSNFSQRRSTPRSEVVLVASGNQSFAGPTASEGTVVVPAAASITDGNTLTLSDGVNPAVVFEFEKTGGVTAGNVAVDISGASTATEVGAALETAINGAANFGFTASNAAGTLTLTSYYGAVSNVTTWASTNATINSALVQPTGGADSTIFGDSGTDSDINDGQLGVICWDESAHLPKGTFLTAVNNNAGDGANTKTDISAIKIVQGTANSADFSGLNAYSNAYGEPSYIASRVITSDQKLEFIGTASTTGRRSAFVIGAVTSGTTSIAPADDTIYTMSVGLHSARRDKIFSHRGLDVEHMSVKTPTFADIGLSSKADKVDWIIQRLVYDAALKSKAVNLRGLPGVGNKPFIAFAIDIDGGGTGTAISGISAGTSIPFVTRNGVTHSYTADAEFVATLAQVVANSSLTTSSEIGVVDITAAAQAHDAILVVALDEPIAGVVRDRETRQKVRLSLALNAALYQANRSTYMVEASTYLDPQGKGRDLYIHYNSRAKKSVWSEQDFGSTLNFLQSPDYIDQTLTYNVFDIYSNNDRLLPEGQVELQSDVTRILVPSSSGVGASNTITDLNAILAPWLNSVGFEYKQTDGGSNLFV